MHLFTILIVLIIAWSMRSGSPLSQGTWSERWRKALFLLLFPALLILSTAIAILYMGCHGAMLGIEAGSFGCAVSATIIIFALGCLCRLAYEGSRSIDRLVSYERRSFDDTSARIIDTQMLYSAQIGFWQSELVVSSGLLATLDWEHLQAVLAHEQAHVYYRDTFWFFWLGWMRSFTAWLPNTQTIWSELLLLRELRADSKAAEEVDFLLLAESLLTVAKNPFLSSDNLCANLNDYKMGDRLNERIESLLDETEPVDSSIWQQWSWIYLVFLPLLIIPLHY